MSFRTKRTLSISPVAFIQVFVMLLQIVWAQSMMRRKLSAVVVRTKKPVVARNRIANVRIARNRIARKQKLWTTSSKNFIKQFSANSYSFHKREAR